MNFYEQEMRSLFAHSGIIQEPKFCGRTMLGKLDDDLRVKAEFVDTFIDRQYDALRLTIINRTDGIVDKNVFKFSDILGKYHHPSGSLLDYHMWQYRDKPEWYTPITATQKAAIADRVLEYVEMFQDQDMAFGGQTM